jgi:hypothetical protein
MDALKKILRAIFEDDGAPSLFSGLVVGGSPAAGPEAASPPGAARRREPVTPATTPSRRSR